MLQSPAERIVLFPAFFYFQDLSSRRQDHKGIRLWRASNVLKGSWLTQHSANCLSRGAALAFSTLQSSRFETVWDGLSHFRSWRGQSQRGLSHHRFQCQGTILQLFQRHLRLYNALWHFASFCLDLLCLLSTARWICWIMLNPGQRLLTFAWTNKVWQRTFVSAAKIFPVKNSGSRNRTPTNKTTNVSGCSAGFPSSSVLSCKMYCTAWSQLGNHLNRFWLRFPHSGGQLSPYAGSPSASPQAQWS